MSELSQYEDICKHAKEEVKNTFTARSQELARRKHLDRVREKNPRNRQQIVSFFQMPTWEEPCQRVATESNTLWEWVVVLLSLLVHILCASNTVCARACVHEYAKEVRKADRRWNEWHTWVSHLIKLQITTYSWLSFKQSVHSPAWVKHFLCQLQ